MEIMKKILLIILFCLWASVGFAESVNFSWIPNTESDLAGYRIYYGETQGTNYTNVVTYDYLIPESDGRMHGIVSGLIAEHIYYFVCTAFDTSNNESNYSNEVSTTVQNTEPPNTPIDLRIN